MMTLAISVSLLLANFSRSLKILSRFLFEEDKKCSMAVNHQYKIKDLESRLSKVEAIIKTKDYLGKEQIDTNSIQVNNQDIEKV